MDRMKGTGVTLVILWMMCAVTSAFARVQRPPNHLWAIPSEHLALEAIQGSKPIDTCVEKFHDSYLDHFVWNKGDQTYKQRYFICDKYWKDRKVTSGTEQKAVKGPIYFYSGNEADVTLYLNATGFMWEHAPKVGALLVFAEHRYYGKSQPFGQDDRENLQFLSSEQALADYAYLITKLKKEYEAEDSPVITFGGSYGGMLSSWFRIKYPHIVHGAFAASAPIWSFLGENPPYDTDSFAEVVTYDAMPAAGSNPNCADNIRDAWKEMLSYQTNSQKDLKELAKAFSLCENVPLAKDQVLDLMYWAQSAFDYMAMGNYPYASSYILNGNGELPPFPMRVSCEHMNDEMTGVELVESLAKAVGVFYNFTANMECFDYRQGVNPETQDVGQLWDYQFCTEMFQPFSRNGVNDMFWSQPWDLEASIKQCQSTWNVTPRSMWATINYGGKKIDSSSNIIFSNGEYDPWKGGGVLQNITDSIHAVSVKGGAHHLDFMWSTPDDPFPVIFARQQERAIIENWISDAYDELNKPMYKM